MTYGEEWRTKMKEQVDLLWMVQHLDADGNPVKHVMFDERENATD